MPTTPKFAFRYPAPDDPDDVPTDMGELALDVEGALSANGVPSPVVNGQWIKGAGGAAVWAPITPADVSGGVGMQRIADVVLAVNGGVDFTVPQTFTHLRLEINARSAAAGNNETLQMRFNGDGGNNYVTAALFAQGTIAQAQDNTAFAYCFCGMVPAAAAVAGMSGHYTIDIPAYREGVFSKVFRSVGGYRYAGSAGLTWQNIVAAGYWGTNGAVTRVHFVNTFAAGTHATLYGLN